MLVDAVDYTHVQFYKKDTVIISNHFHVWQKKGSRLIWITRHHGEVTAEASDTLTSQEREGKHKDR